MQIRALLSFFPIALMAFCPRCYAQNPPHPPIEQIQAYIDNDELHLALPECRLLYNALLFNPTYQPNQENITQEQLHNLFRSIETRLSPMLLSLQNMELDVAKTILLENYIEAGIFPLNCSQPTRDALLFFTRYHKVQLSKSSPEEALHEARVLFSQYPAFHYPEQSQQILPLFLQIAILNKDLPLFDQILQQMDTHTNKSHYDLLRLYLRKMMGMTLDGLKEELSSSCSYDPTLLQQLLKILQGKTTQAAIALRKQIEALCIYLQALHDPNGVPNEQIMECIQENDPFSIHLLLLLNLKEGAVDQAYALCQKLTDQYPEYTNIDHAWFQMALALQERSDTSDQGTEILTQLAEEKLLTSPYATVAQLLLFSGSLPPLPEERTLESEEDHGRAALCYYVLAESAVSTSETEGDLHEAESAILTAFNYLENAKKQIQKVADFVAQPLLAPPLIEAHIARLELELLEQQALRTKRISLDVEQLTSNAHALAAVAAKLRQQAIKGAPYDLQFVQIVAYEAEYAKFLKLLAEQNFSEAKSQLQALQQKPPLFHTALNTTRSICTAHLLLVRELINTGAIDEALIWSQIQQTQSSLEVFRELELGLERSRCYKLKKQYPLAIGELSRIINSESATSLRVQAALMRADLYHEMGRKDLACKQLEAVRKKGGQWGQLADKKLDEYIHPLIQ